MKKYFLLIVLVFTAFSLLCFSGCTSNDESPAAPGATATPAPYFLTQNEEIDFFEDEDLTSTLNTPWTFESDSADGGTSTITAYGITGIDTGTTSALAVTASIKASLSSSASDYTSSVGSEYGYIKIGVSLLKNSAGVSLSANNNNLRFRYCMSDTANMNFKVYIYDTVGNFVRTGTISPQTTWWYISSNYNTAFALPAGASYTVDSVLTHAAKIEWVFRYYDSSGSTKSLSIFLDGVQSYFIP